MFVADPVAEEPLRAIESAGLVERVHALITREIAAGALDERALVILEARIWGERETLEAVGARLGITRERVRQIEAKALERIRLALAREGVHSAAQLLGEGESHAPDGKRKKVKAVKVRKLAETPQ